MSYNDHCKGCFSNIYRASEKIIPCQLSYYNDKGQCACSVCIVKVMCQDVCDDFVTFRNAVTKQRRAKRNDQINYL